MQLLEYARAIKKGLSMLADSTRTYTPRTMDMTFTKVQLEEIYAIKLDIQLSDPAIAGRLRHITCMLQRAARHGRIMRLVQSSLDTRSKYHAAVLAMESELQKLGLDSYMQVRAPCPLRAARVAAGGTFESARVACSDVRRRADAGRR